MSKQQLDASTEEKILATAKKIFTQKGYEATKVRDIAAEADINLSLVNYYFRSKEKLFEHIMVDNINKLFEKVGPVLNDEKSSLQQKISFIAEHYIDLLLENPDLPRFVVNEVLSGSNKIEAISSKRALFQQSHFAKQIFALQAEGKIKFEPVQVMMNLMGMLIFPFLGQKLFNNIGVQPAGFREMMEARKQLIPVWIDAIINS
ncbi:TetR family transcriptional regulator [Mucilaginibacter sp. cycad4]|uniref:TetR/AcrR family transcriptional regulator n=1 Tax=Mucilaginibacter sp. cycad4 TaxID=3342096 RepID=UPI002AAB7775|nr:TetR family transcriptional regulator [Mucilaginibacter gossypii]WPV01567.1 TetR family transcriptional regulator [Mucilaginibacter gossypii]